MRRSFPLFYRRFSVLRNSAATILLLLAGCAEPLIEPPAAGAIQTAASEITFEGAGKLVMKDLTLDAALDQPGKTVVVDFGADWCGPCKLLEPELEKLADDRRDLCIVKVNVDDNPEIAAHFRASSIPLICVFRDRKSIKRLYGFRTADALSSAIPEK